MTKVSSQEFLIHTSSSNRYRPTYTQHVLIKIIRLSLTMDFDGIQAIPDVIVGDLFDIATQELICYWLP